jgi:23S rRNA (cytidine1920-2'-O)/16S rRNA (cytidine1409-2'-O)-methyltransferase
LLQNGAGSVHAFDVGKGQLAWKLQSDPRVFVRDAFNVRNLGPADLPDNVALVSIDLSFISVTKILPALKDALSSGRRCANRECGESAVDVIVLVKPQFEVGKGEVGKGGIVRDPDKRLTALEGVSKFAARTGFRVLGSIPSPVPGAEGNQEFLLHLQLPRGLLSLP